MKAWLLTWEWTSIKPVEKIVAIFSSRRSPSTIADIMELMVLRSHCSAKDLAYYANRKSKMVYKARSTFIINDIPHADRVLCGYDPWLYGRKVEHLKITLDKKNDEEIISWQEPDIFKWADESKKSIVVASAGEVKMWRRSTKPLSRDVWAWDLPSRS